MNSVLSSDRFSVVAREGLGRPSNTVAHSMAQHGGYVYVGSTSPSGGPDSAPRILRFDPQAEEWEEVFEPDFVDADKRGRVADIQQLKNGGRAQRLLQSRNGPAEMARDYGFRSLISYKGESDRKACLYATTMSRWGGRVLRSEDGIGFGCVSEPGLGDNEILSFRGLTEFDGKLFMAPVGTITDAYMDRNLAKEAMVYVSADPHSGRWEKACEPGIGDTRNRTVFSIAATKDFLYAGTGNPERGFQLWRTNAQGKPPYTWTRVLTDGAFRYGFNFATAAMIEFQGALYVGGGIPGFGYDNAHDVGPAAAELIRVNPDGSWDLIFGEPRFTPDGLKVPLSGMGPGLDNPFNSVAWSLCVHDAVLYVGTNNWEPFDCLEARDDRAIAGGFELWGSVDGENWEQILSDGNGNPGATGVRTLRSTPWGLFVGTCNHTHLLQILGSAKGHRQSVSGIPAGFEVLRAI